MQKTLTADVHRADPEANLALQSAMLARHVEFVAENSPFYRKLFVDAGIDPKSIRRQDDLAAIPCTTKENLIADPEAFLAVARDEIVDVCLTSSTTGVTPSMLLQTRSDLERLARNEAATYALAGMTNSDRLLICVAIDKCFMAGMAYFLGAVEAGIETIRAGSASAAQAWELARLTRPTAIMSTAGMLRHLADAAVAAGDDPTSIGVKRMLIIGDSVRDASLQLTPAAAALEASYRAKIYGTYASTEMATAFSECEAGAGGHIHPGLMVAEILDDDGRPCAPGRPGEVVATPLGVRGMPLLRFRTGDIAFMIDQPCACGRSTPRLGPILGRKKQMLKFKGTTLFPTTILGILGGVEGVCGCYVEARRFEDGTDRVVVCVARANGGSLIENQLTALLQARLRVTPELRLVSLDDFNRRINVPGKRKPQFFFDLREGREE